MSADCLFVLRGVIDTCGIINNITCRARDLGCGVSFSPVNALLSCNQLSKCNDTVMFAPTDTCETYTADLLLNPDNYLVNGIRASAPLFDRLLLIQQLAEVSIQHADCLEIYLSEDNAYLPDYTIHQITCDQVADVLLEEYQRDTFPYQTVPCVCLYVYKAS